MDLKILIGSWEVPPLTGGPSYYVKELVENLSKHVDVKVIAPSFTTLNNTTNLEIRRIETRNIPALRVSEFVLKANLTARGIKADLVHDNGILSFTSASPFIETWHHMERGFSSFGFSSAGLFGRYRELITVKGVKKADAIIAVSSLSAKQLIRFYSVPSSKIEIIPNGVDSDFFRPSIRTKRRNENGHYENKLLFVGGLVKRKNVSSLVMAVRKVLKDGCNVHLYIVGRGPEEKYLKNLQRELSLHKTLTFLGTVSREELLHLYNTSDYLIQPSYREGFGRTMVEALLCETPVITTPTGIGYEIEKNNLGVLARDFSPNSIADAIKEAVINKGNFKNLRRFAFENFDWSKVVKKILVLYNKLLETCK